MEQHIHCCDTCRHDLSSGFELWEPDPPVSVTLEELMEDDET